ncbi:MAG: DUF84 family protein [bacterium]|nr:DUF84 family protein [bacterium]
MRITICGSMRFANKMEDWRKKLIEKGFEVFVPGGIEDLNGYKEAGTTEEAVSRKISNDYIRSHYRYIQQSEGILILNYDKDDVSNYIGANSLMEMGFAFTQNRDIFLLNPAPDTRSRAEINAMQPIVINGEIDKIVEYYDNLPQVFLSSESKIKINSTSLAFREFDMRYRIVGFKTVSGINEQPFSIEETHLGAKNRLENLKELTNGKRAKYYVSIESGDAILHSDYNYFGLSVCMIEDEKDKRAVTIATDLEIPKELTDLVPSKYSDLGILVQDKYGIKNKDPYVYFTHGKITRDKLVLNTVVNTIACLQTESLSKN